MLRAEIINACYSNTLVVGRTLGPQLTLQGNWSTRDFLFWPGNSFFDFRFSLPGTDPFAKDPCRVTGIFHHRFSLPGTASFAKDWYRVTSHVRFLILV